MSEKNEGIKKASKREGGGKNRREDKERKKGLAGFLIRNIKGEMAPGLRGNQHCLQLDYSWHNPDTVLFDVPRPSVLYVVFYLTLK